MMTELFINQRLLQELQAIEAEHKTFVNFIYNITSQHFGKTDLLNNYINELKDKIQLSLTLPN